MTGDIVKVCFKVRLVKVNKDIKWESEDKVLMKGLKTAECYAPTGTHILSFSPLKIDDARPQLERRTQALEILLKVTGNP